MEFAIGSLVIRSLNALVWTVVVAKIVRNDKPVSGMARRLISVVIFLGFWALVYGAIVPFGVNGSLARLVYTSYTAIALMIGVALATEKGGP